MKLRKNDDGVPGWAELTFWQKMLLDQPGEGEFWTGGARGKGVRLTRAEYVAIHGEPPIEGGDDEVD